MGAFPKCPQILYYLFMVKNLSIDQVSSLCERSEQLGNSELVSQESRKHRWRLRNVVKEISRIKRLRNCGNVLGRAVAVQKLSSGAPAYGGLESCSSVWSCPVCSSKIAAYRQTQLSQLMEKANSDGKFVSMMTLTQRHNNGQKLDFLWESLSDAWKYTVSCKKYRVFKEQIGLVGYVRAVEVTHGANGWHVHTHILFITDKPIDSLIFYQRGQGMRKTPYPLEEFKLKDLFIQRWGERLAKRGIGFDSRIGIDLQQAKKGTEKILSAYIGKVFGNISAEMTLGNFKKARKKDNRTPFQILADIRTYGDMQDVNIWHIWEKFSTGKRQLIWSRGLKDYADIEDLLTDEEVLSQDTVRETLFFINRNDWKFLIESAIGAKLLDIIQHYRVEHVVQFCLASGVSVYFKIEHVPK